MIPLFVLSFGGKEQAVTFPVCLLWIDWACRRNFRDRKVWIEKIPFVLLTCFFAYITFQSYGTNIAGFFEKNDFYPFTYRVVFACYSFSEYMVKIFIPVNLLYIYPFPIQAGELLPLRFLIYPALLSGIFSLRGKQNRSCERFWQSQVWYGCCFCVFPLTREHKSGAITTN